jgi:hypothetical protein
MPMNHFETEDFYTIPVLARLAGVRIQSVKNRVTNMFLMQDQHCRCRSQLHSCAEAVQEEFDG